MSCLIIVNQKISEWIKKGEIVENYFNPNKFFKKIIILSLVKDEVNKKSLYKLCGVNNTKFVIIDSFLTNKFFQLLIPNFIQMKILRKNFDKMNIKKIKLVRSIGDDFAGFYATSIAEKNNYPVFVSIHSFVNFYIFFFLMSFKEKIMYLLMFSYRQYSHRKATRIIIVYRYILNKINKVFHYKTVCIENLIPVQKIHTKKNYSIKEKCNLICIGRLIKGKSPEIILKAISELKLVDLTIIGDGPLEKKIKNMILNQNLKFKIKLIKSMKNIEILQILKNYDAFICFDTYYEFPKTIIEAILAGLPVIANKKTLKKQFEFKNLKIFWCDENVNSLKKTIKDLIENERLRKIYSQHNTKIAWKLYSQDAIEKKVINLYQKTFVDI